MTNDALDDPGINPVLESSFSTYLHPNHPLKERPVLFALDVSGSCWFNLGKNPYMMAMQKVVTTIGTAFETAGHEVGACFFTEQIELYQAPKKKAVSSILDLLLSMIPVSKKTDIVSSLENLLSYQESPSIIVVISDFKSHYNSLFLSQEKRGQFSKTTHHILPIVLGESSSDNIPQIGLLNLEDPETESQVIINTYSKNTREKYDMITLLHRHYRRRFFKVTNWTPIFLNQSETLPTQIQEWFRIANNNQEEQ